MAIIAIAALSAGGWRACGREPGRAGAPGEARGEGSAAAANSGEARADLYARLAASTDADETEGLVGLLIGTFAQSGSDTADLLLQRARKAMGEKEYDAAEEILDSTVALLPDWAEGWNARATLRYLDDDFDGSMADIAEVLKREPRHLGALLGMSHILEARDKKEQALKVCERVLSIAPHWRSAEKTADRLKAAIAGEEL